MKDFTNSFNIRFNNRFYAFLILIITWFPGFAQNVGINSTGAAPNAAAGLDVDFPDKGVLIPRVALTGTANFAPLTAHVAGMVVYNTATAGDVAPGFYYNDGTKWVPGFPAGNATGNMVYWNGTAWVMVPVGTPGQFLQLDATSTPMWGGGSFATLTTTPVTAIATTTASSGGTVVSDGGSTILSRGICYATTINPTTANSTVAGAATSPYTCNLSGLVAGTIYYVRAYSVNSSVTSYGNQLSFATLATITTTAATLITANSARTGGTVTTGNAPVTERGVCYATTTNPTTANSKIVDPGTGAGAFVSDITGLADNTLYYVRSYVINASGTSYGNQITITTLSTLTTTAISGLLPNAAASGGTINVGGAQNISARGVCWSTSTGPTIALTTKTNNGTGTGVFTSSITGLLGSTTYYVRAYATNAGGTAYGNEISFTTPAPILATLTTTAISNIAVTTASSGGTITDDGGAPITTRGVCWSLVTGPTTADNIFANGTGTGAFPGTLSPLTSNTTYYVRAYATNSAGTAYGNELSFTTCTTPIYTIGQAVGGGIVFYVDCSGQHGLIAATADQGSAMWGCSGTTFNTSPNYGTGAANTAAILAGCATRPIAASLASSYTGGGFTDWYLPSSAEMVLMMNQRTVLGLGYALTYITSTDNGSTTVASCYYYTGSVYATSATKNYATVYIRAIRSF